MKTQAEFAAYHKANPEIYTHIVTEAIKYWAAGERKSSVYRILNDHRWDEHCKVSNDYIQCYTRKLLNDFPILKGMFTIKALGKRICKHCGK